MSYVDSLGNSVQANTNGVRPIASLTGVSAVQGGTALDGLSTRTTAVMVVTSSAGVSAGSVQCQGSLDGTNWYALGSPVTTSAASTTTAVVVTSGACRYVRAQIATAVTGGTISATVGLSG